MITHEKPFQISNCNAPIKAKAQQGGPQADVEHTIWNAQGWEWENILYLPALPKCFVAVGCEALEWNVANARSPCLQDSYQ